MVNVSERPMSEIKALFLDAMEPGRVIEPMSVIRQLHERTGISQYDLKAALWYLIGDGELRFDDRRAVIKVDKLETA